MDEITSPKFPKRRSPARGVYERPGQPTIVFVTVCVNDRKNILANDATHGALRQTWHETVAWNVGRYVVMPDHLHFFASPGETDTDLETWTRYWKRKLNKRLATPVVWQAGHWDTRMRSAKHYAETWDYVRENPVRAGLAEQFDEWRFQGEMFDLTW